MMFEIRTVRESLNTFHTGLRVQRIGTLQGQSSQTQGPRAGPDLRRRLPRKRKMRLELAPLISPHLQRPRARRWMYTRLIWVVEDVKGRRGQAPAQIGFCSSKGFFHLLLHGLVFCCVTRNAELPNLLVLPLGCSSTTSRKSTSSGCALPPPFCVAGHRRQHDCSYVPAIRVPRGYQLVEWIKN